MVKEPVDMKYYFVQSHPAVHSHPRFAALQTNTNNPPLHDLKHNYMLSFLS